MVSATNLELLVTDFVMNLEFSLSETVSPVLDTLHALDSRVELVLKLSLDDAVLSNFLMSAGVINHTIGVQFSQSFQGRLDGAGDFGENLFEVFLALMGGLDPSIIISLVATTAFATAAAPTATTRFAAASSRDRLCGRDCWCCGVSPVSACSTFGGTGGRGIGLLVRILHDGGSCMWVLME